VQREGARREAGAVGGVRKLNVLVWQIHGSYLNTLVQSFAGAPYRFYLPTKPVSPRATEGAGRPTPGRPRRSRYRPRRWATWIWT
jgi:hypothetical protein